ncbi:MAG: hypothetical protein SFV54_26655, partial [Bryobacteraceae bacterium]|nr:hypothetical protein [Bryobacteraceae bacterium]
ALAIAAEAPKHGLPYLDKYIHEQTRLHRYALAELRRLRKDRRSEDLPKEAEKFFANPLDPDPDPIPDPAAPAGSDNPLDPPPPAQNSEEANPADPQTKENEEPLRPAAALPANRNRPCRPNYHPHKEIRLSRRLDSTILHRQDRHLSPLDPRRIDLRSGLRRVQKGSI